MSGFPVTDFRFSGKKGNVYFEYVIHIARKLQLMSLNILTLFQTAYYIQRSCYYLFIASFSFKDTHWEKEPSNKIPALAKSTNMGILVYGISTLYKRFLNVQFKIFKKMN